MFVVRQALWAGLPQCTKPCKYEDHSAKLVQPVNSPPSCASTRITHIN
jgi:hypothetical protein